MLAYIPKHFRAYEFLPKQIFTWCERSKLPHQGLLHFIDSRILISADTLRDFFGVAVTVNDWKWGGTFQWRGFRNPSSPVFSSSSQHSFGRACDCTIEGVPADEARLEIMKHKNRFPFITRLEDQVNWVHFDCLNCAYSRIHLFTA